MIPVISISSYLWFGISPNLMYDNKGKIIVCLCDFPKFSGKTTVCRARRFGRISVCLRNFAPRTQNLGLLIRLFYLNLHVIFCILAAICPHWRRESDFYATIYSKFYHLSYFSIYPINVTQYSTFHPLFSKVYLDFVQRFLNSSRFL